ncbi:hypothetical protein L3Q82_004221 [Scortum barcoo]|uniref:Uncharacterized protein n=1 Tax=Scortum barcoo TaxID=214431 RepID=A0ACB8VJX8_9TELE|nr:hypothetical protein L3Q82_004221 [Scortum barcoo]
MDRISRRKRSQGPEGVRFGNHRISSLLFADDVVLLASSSQDLQHVLERFAAECEAAGMRISTSKSEAMVLDDDGKGWRALSGVAGRSLRDRGEKLGHSGGARSRAAALLRIERSQLRWLGHLFRMPPGRLPREVFQACPPPGGGLGEDPGHAGETMSLDWPGNAWGSPRIPPEELEEVSGNCSALLSYSRHELLDIWTQNSNSFIADLRLIPEISRTPEAAHSSRPGGSARRRRRERKQRRGKRGGLRAKLKLIPHRLPLPSIFLANVRSLANKMDEIRLSITNNRRIMDSNVMFFTETKLNNSCCLDTAIELAGRHTHRADRIADDSGKTRGGGLCIYINKAWCMDSATAERQCSPNVEFLMVKCRPYYLPREFTSIILTAVYTPSDANAKLAMKELYAAISKHQTKHPEAAFIVAGDFNHSNLKTVLPRFHQHVSCHTRGEKTLDHVYSNLAGAYKATPLPHIGQSDHLSLFLTPRLGPVRLICTGPHLHHYRQCHHPETDHITMYPNQKPWMNRDVRLLLKARNTAFRSGDAQAYSTARAELKRGIKKAKHRYKGKVEKHFTNSNPRRTWQGLQIITDYKTTSPSPTSSDVSFLNELNNNFYARFERGNTATATKAAVTPDHQPLTLSSPDDVGAVLGRIVVHKAAGPDGIPGRVLRACSGELAEVLTDIFNLSLAHAVVPTCFKSTSIIPVPKNSKPSSLNDYTAR